MVGGRPPFSVAFTWFCGPRMQAAASKARSGCFEKAPTPRLMPPRVTRLGWPGTTLGHRAQPMLAAIWGAFFWALGQTKE